MNLITKVLDLVQVGAIALPEDDVYGECGVELAAQVGIGSHYVCHRIKFSYQPRLRRLWNFSLPIIASGAAIRNRLTAATPAGVSSDGALHEPPDSGAGPGTFVGSTGAGVDVGMKVDMGVGTRVGVGVGGSVVVGIGVCGGGGVANPLMVSVKLPVCSPETGPVEMRVLWDDLNWKVRRIVP